MMKRTALYGILGGIFGTAGWLLLYLTDLRPLGWMVPSVALGVLSGGRGLGAAVGGGTMFLGLFIGRLVHYPMIAWPLLGAALGLWTSARPKNGAIGFVVGLLSVHLLPLFTMVLLPLLGFPTTFDYDVEGAALVLGGVALGAMIGVMRRL